MPSNGKSQLRASTAMQRVAAQGEEPFKPETTSDDNVISDQDQSAIIEQLMQQIAQANDALLQMNETLFDYGTRVEVLTQELADANTDKTEISVYANKTRKKLEGALQQINQMKEMTHGDDL